MGKKKGLQKKYEIYTSLEVKLKQLMKGGAH